VANPANLFGFKAISRDSGGPILTHQYGKAATGSTTAIFMNDLVIKYAASVADPTGLGNPMPGIASAQGATPGTTLLLGASLNYGAASTATAHYVVDSIDAIFIGAVDGSLAVTTASHVGKNANIKNSAGSTTTKQSGMGVDNTTIATNAGLDLRILRVSNIVPNAEGANAIVEVSILKHALAEGSAGL
jgi:hypothetical protein